MSIFINSSEAFVTNEIDLIMSGVSERCMCGSLMLILRRELDQTQFSNYYTDIEYNRNFDGDIKTMINDNMEVSNITCDLIVHSRGLLPHDNLIAIEMKRNTHTETEKNKDRIRLRALNKATNDSETYSVDGRVLPQHVCGYIVGIFYEINIVERIVDIEYYQAGDLYGSYRRRL